jgi:hypothetical protein
MAKTSGGIRPIRKVVDYDKKNEQIRKETLDWANSITKKPINFRVTNGIEMDVEVSKSDIKRLVIKSTDDAKFNAIKNKLAQDVKGYIKKAKYVGWRETEPNKHFESAYFVYYNRTLGANTYLSLRRMKNSNIYKPYMIMDEKTFNANKHKIKTKMPPK